MTSDTITHIRLGGLRATREVERDDPFERDMDDLFGERLRADESFGYDMWSAMANVDWKHPEHGRVSASYRYAGDLIAAILQDKQTMAYTRWYCGSTQGVVSAEIRDAMATKGWTAQVAH